jgi:dihydrofolate reductase
MSVQYNVIVAATEKGGIGLKNNLPWRLKGDMKYFKDVTTGEDKGKFFGFLCSISARTDLHRHS